MVYFLATIFLIPYNSITFFDAWGRFKLIMFITNFVQDDIGGSLYFYLLFLLFLPYLLYKLL